MSNLIGSFEEVGHTSLVSEIVVQVLLSDSKGLELLYSIIVVGNLWEGKLFLVDSYSFDLEGWVLKASSFDFILNS